MQFTPSLFHSTTRAVAFPRVFRSLRSHCWLPSVYGVLTVMLGGSWTSVHAQTAHFAGVETTIAQGAVSSPGQTAIDTSGNIYVTDTGNNRIVKESPANGGYQQTVVDSNGFNGPLGVAVDSTGNLYVADTGNNRIVEETPSNGGYTAIVLPISGLNNPVSIAVDSTFNLYVSDAGNSRVVKEAFSGSNYSQSEVLTGVIGGELTVDSGGDTIYLAVPGSGEVVRTGTTAGSSQTIITGGLSNIIGVAVDPAGVVYIADAANGKIIRVYLTGNYNVESTTLETPMVAPGYLTIDGNDTLYFADSGGASLHALALGGYTFGSVPVGTASAKASLLFSFDSGGSIASPSVVLQGITGMDFSDIGTGSCTTNGSEHLYATGDVCTVDVTFRPQRAGWRNGAAVLSNGSGVAIATGYVRGWGDGPQLTYLPGTVRTYTLPGQTNANIIIADATGNLYINHAVAAFDSGNAVYKETWTGSGYIQSLVATNLAYPLNIALDGAGNIYVLDEGVYDIFKFSPNADGSYTKSTFDTEQPNANALAVDGAGNVYFANSDNVYIGSIQIDTPQGGYYGNQQTSVASRPNAIVVDGNQNIYFDPYGTGNLGELMRAGGNYNGPTDISGTSTDSLAIDGMGNIYTLFSSQLDKLTPSGGSFQESVLNTVAAQFSSVTVDGNGNLYWIESNTGTVQKLDFSNPPALHFAATPPGLTSSNSPQTLTIANLGGEPLLFPAPSSGTNPVLPEGFALTTGGSPECPVQTANSSAAGVLAGGASCQYEVSYSPLNSSDSSGWMTLTDDNLNQTSPAYALQSIPLAVAGSPLTPTVSWSDPTGISYGTALNTLQLNATSSVPGSFAYTPAAGSVLTVGTHTLSATFTPDDTTAFSIVTGSVSIAVTQATPPISWSAPSAITYSTALSSTQLDASTPVAGTFSYSPAAGTVLAAGAQTLTVTFTPADATDYTVASAQVTLTVNQVTPTIAWATPSAITYGTALSGTQLNATASAPGTFSYSSPAGTILTAGIQAITATFKPTDTTDYQTVTDTIYLTVNRASPTITWATPTAITYGTPLSGTQLDATASVPGFFYYSTPSGSILTAGSHTITASFYPNDLTDYAYTTANVTLAVNQATPTIDWATPAAITSGTALSATQLDATASVPGTFVYNPALGTTPPVGNDPLSVIFTPTDNLDYATSTASVTLTVNVPLNPVPFLGNIAPAIANAGGAAFTITVNGSGFLPGSIVYWGTSALTTQFVSSTQLTATVAAAEIATPGATALNVQTPAPGGGTSDVLQFEVDSSSGSATAPTVPSTVVTVTAGTTATYSISFPASVTNATATCLNLPAGAICSYSFATGVLTISTSSTTPSGTYQVTVVFAETVASTSSALILLPFLLLPLFFLRKNLTSRGTWPAVWLSLILLAATAFSVGCGGSSSSVKTTTTQSVMSSGVVGMVVQ